MASAASPLPQRNAASRAPAPAPTAPQGTFLPGTKVQVGSHRVTIEKYLSEGGFAHVYVVRVPRDNNKYELGVLKRVAVPDKDHLASMRTEVETMKKLNGHKQVVSYMDSHASPLKNGGYEVFLLMEYCAGGGLIDFMNTRLQHRLTEPEILKIFGDVAEGVACMHYLKPPLLHRDLKVENVLISKSNSGTPTYKICDFGSTAPPRPAAKTAEEGRLIEEDVQKNTTLQYRSPEMIDVWRKQPIDEKADVWALGVLLYKLCYYTTPFEAVGQMAILNASFKYPPSPSFSSRTKELIGWMLKEDPKKRPNIYQIVKEVCSMRGAEVPIKDIYAQRTHSQARRNESLPTSAPPMSIGLQKTAPEVQVQSIPDIAPMRRGRPAAPAQQKAAAATKPSPSPARGDPFAALDSKNYDVRAGAVDELSKRFPSLDEFSITHEKGGNFQFSQQSSRPPTENTNTKLNEQLTNALADDAFGQSKPKAETARQLKPTAEIPKAQTASQIPQTQPSDKPTNVKERIRDISQQSPLVHQPTPVRPGMKYTSTGTGTSPPPVAAKKQFPEITSRPIWKVPSQRRSSSQPRASETAQAAAATLQPSLPPSQRPALLDLHRSKSQTNTSSNPAPTSSRPSLEGHRPSHLELDEPAVNRAKSAGSRQRPSSVYVSSNLDYLRDQEASRKPRPVTEGRRHSRHGSNDPRASLPKESSIDDDMEYLRSSEHTHLPHRHSSSHHHKKRPSMHGIPGTRHLMGAGGKLGEAFKRPGHHTGDDTAYVPESEIQKHGEEENLISPVDAPVSATNKHADEEYAIDETEDLPPDMRRELERRRLSQEEKRVAQAAAEYRARIADQGTGTSSIPPPTRASTIQKRVQSLLDEGRQSPVPQKKTAEGYGRYTDQPASDIAPPSPIKAAAPPIAKKPIATPETSGNPYQKTRQQAIEPPPASVIAPSASAPPVQQTLAPQSLQRVASRPSVPPKAQGLRTGGGAAGKTQWPPSSQPDIQAPAATSKPSSGLAALLAKDLEGVPDYPPRGSSARAAGITTNADAQANLAVPSSLDGTGNGDGYDEVEFSKRYPSLRGIEMVETEISGEETQPSGPRRRWKDV